MTRAVPIAMIIGLGAAPVSADEEGWYSFSSECSIWGEDGHSTSRHRLSGRFKLDLPAGAYVGEPVTVPYTVEAHLAGGPALAELGAVGFEGPGGVPLYITGVPRPDVRTPATVPLQSGDALAGFVWRGSGTLPPLTADRPGTVRFQFDSFVFRLSAKMPDGTTAPINMGCLWVPAFDQVGSYPVVAATRHADLAVSGTTRLGGLGADVALGPGALAADLDLRTGALTGDLALPAGASTGFTLLGFLPGTVTMRPVTDGELTGVLTGGVLTAEAEATLGFTDFSILGIPLLAGGTDCRTATPATISLTSAPGFDLQRGGTLTGAYDLPALTGCGPLTGLVSHAATGPGNTLTLTLTTTPA